MVGLLRKDQDLRQGQWGSELLQDMIQSVLKSRFKPHPGQVGPPGSDQTEQRKSLPSKKQH